jgi:hypothetical protein
VSDDNLSEPTTTKAIEAVAMVTREPGKGWPNHDGANTQATLWEI